MKVKNDMTSMHNRLITKFACVVSVFAFVGCAQETTQPPPSGARAESPLFQAVGKKWRYKSINSRDGVSSESGNTVVSVTYRGKAAYGVSTGTVVNVLDPVSLNYLATLRDGKEETVATPEITSYSWPLWAGKSWTFIYKYEDIPRGMVFDGVRENVKVIAYEDVTVPAGTFKAFRIERYSLQGVRFVTSWYAPEIGMNVKSITERSNDHYLGANVATTELLTRPE